MMNRLKKNMTILALIGSLFSGAAQAVEIDLYDYGFNIDGVVSVKSLGDPVPAAADVSLFDLTTGLGTISVGISGAGAHSFDLFVDHEIDEAINTYFNEFGSVTGTPSAGQSWEIDEPEYVFGDIFTNFAASALDNSNAVPAGFEDDVSMAMGWDFTLAADETATIEMIVGEMTPVDGFYLSHTDSDSSATIFFSSRLTIAGGGPGPGSVPEPGTLLLLGLGLAGLAALQRRSHCQGRIV